MALVVNQASAFAAAGTGHAPLASMALTTLHCLFGIREIQVRAKHALLIATFVIPIIAAACSNHGSSPSQVAPSAAIVSPTDDSPRGDPRPADPPENPACTFVEQGYGPKGTTRVRAETVVTGLDVPWSLTFLPDGDMLVTERPGRIRLVHNGVLVRDPVATVPVARDEEGGLLGLALDPDVAKTHRFFIYRTTDEGGQRSNRVERWHLADDARTAQFERVIVDRIAASPYHNGGRLRIGPDRMLYIGTGDARHPDSSQDPDSINGKILRVALDGAPAPNNPWPNRRAYITGLRNVEAFDWSTSALWSSRIMVLQASSARRDKMRSTSRVRVITSAGPRFMAAALATAWLRPSSAGATPRRREVACTTPARSSRRGAAAFSSQRFGPSIYIALRSIAQRTACPRTRYISQAIRRPGSAGCAKLSWVRISSCT